MVLKSNYIRRLLRLPVNHTMYMDYPLILPHTLESHRLQQHHLKILADLAPLFAAKLAGYSEHLLKKAKNRFDCKFVWF